MAAIATWAGFVLRRQSRTLLALALLVALAGATVLTAFAGARRGSSALDRLRAETLPATAVVLPNEPGFRWDAVAQLPEVETVAPFVVSYVGDIDGVDSAALSFPFTSPNFLTSIERPVIFEGRNVDVTRADEVLVTPQFVRATGLGVGDRIGVTLPTPEENATATPDPTATDHPTFEVTIVGVGESNWLMDLPGRDSGTITLSPGVAAAYPDNVIGRQEPGDLNYLNALVRLRGGEDAIPAFERGLAELTGRNDIEIWNVAEQSRELQRHVDFESRWLIAFGLAALLAAVILVGQAIVRLAATGARELDTARALGMTTRHAVVAATIAPAGAGLVGALMAGLGAVLASRWMPIGTAGFFEPSPGSDIDAMVVGLGALTIFGVVVIGGAWSARRTLVTGPATNGRSGSRIATLVGRTGVGTPVQIGARFALEPGRGRSAVPVGPALLGAVCGVLGVVAAFSFAAGVDDAVGNPERFGQVADAGMFLGANGFTFVGVDVSPLIDTLAELPEVAVAADTRTTVATAEDGGVTLSLWEYRPPPTGIRAVTVVGRMPETRDEISLGPTTLDLLGVAIGDSVRLAGPLGVREFMVTGTAFVVEGPHNGYAEGGWVTTDGFDRIDDGFTYRLALIDLQPDADVDAAIASIDAELAAVDPSLGGSIEAAGGPDEIAQLAQVRRLPIALAVFLALLAVAAVGHSLASAVRRRAGDLAVLRALGMTRGQTRMVIATQATVLALVGVLLGVPLGLLVGMRIWRSIADFTPFEYQAPWDLWALVLVGPVALAAANLLGVGPARKVARLAVARTLRAE